MSTAEADTQPVKQRGIVKWWNEEKGFGFIIPEEPGCELFAHHSQIMLPAPRLLTQGQAVSYVLGTDHRGRPRAEQVIPVASESPYRC